MNQLPFMIGCGKLLEVGSQHLAYVAVDLSTFLQKQITADITLVIEPVA